MRETWLTPLEALQAATLNVAEYLNATDSRGDIDAMLYKFERTARRGTPWKRPDLPTPAQPAGTQP